MSTKTIRDVEIFAVGVWNGRSFDRADLDAMVEAFDALHLANRLPVKLGHGARDTEPAQGWIAEMRRADDRVLATLAQVPVELVDDIKEGRWRHVSIELLSDVVADGREYPLVPSGLAILGSASPAVSVLKPLNAMMTRALPAGFAFRERMAFSRAPDEAEALRAENRRLNLQLLKQAQDGDVRSQRVQRAEVERFTRRYRDNATLDDWRAWVETCPAPPAIYRRNATPATSRSYDSGDPMPAHATPDVEVVHLAQAEIEKSGGKLTFSAAQLKVLRANPELAERYRCMPGVKDQ